MKAHEEVYVVVAEEVAVRVRWDGNCEVNLDPVAMIG